MFLGHLTLRPIRRKAGILQRSSGIQVHTQGVSPQDTTIFQTDLGSLGLLLRKCDGCLDVGLPFPVSVGIFTTLSDSAEIATGKGSANKWIHAVSVTQHTVCWERYIPSRKARHQQRVCF